MDAKALLMQEALVEGKTAATQSDGQAHNSHPYLSGNFAAIRRTLPLTPCSYTGTIPPELVGGQYVRNGGNPLQDSNLDRDAHWFDGDGMLSGVLFRRVVHAETRQTVGVQPEFVNQYILTDLHLASQTSQWLSRPMLPSIATLVSPNASLFTVICGILRAVILVFLSHLPGSEWAVKKISVANTAIIWHDGRALATCESGPPMRVMLPGLETVGWYDGKRAENEGSTEQGRGFGAGGLTGWMREWTTGHPRVDPITGELISYHNTFLSPYVHYSVVPSTQHSTGKQTLLAPSRLLNVPVPGVSGAKMMHDFGVSLNHTVIMDLPLTLNPVNLARNKPIVSYDPMERSRFGVFPRYRPDLVKWFETRACLIFHTANTWDTIETDPETDEAELCVNMLACRLTSASLVYSAGNLAAPQAIREVPPEHREEEQCRLYYYQFPFAELSPPSSPATESSRDARSYIEGKDDSPFDPFSSTSSTSRLSTSSTSSPNSSTSQKPIRHEFALSAIPFEFPTSRPSTSMSATRYIYGCSSRATTGFGASLGTGVKISHIAKIDALALIERGKCMAANGEQLERVRGCVDTRTMEEVMASTDPADPIKCFEMPAGWYAQEASFVARQQPASGPESSKKLREDDGYLLTYVFDESQLDPRTGMARENAVSELWVIGAKEMREVVCRVRLPQRVPYGLHGNWFDERMVAGQRKVSGIRTLPVEELDGDEEVRVRSPGSEKANPFESMRERAERPQQGQTGKGKAKAALAKRKWSPAWRAWMVVRDAIERKLA